MNKKCHTQKPFDGQISRVMMFDFALSAAQISDLHNVAINTKQEKTMDVLFLTRFVGLLVWAVILGAGKLAARAWVATQLWSWFVVPYFNLPELSVLLAAGLLLSQRVFQDLRHIASDPKPHETWRLRIAKYLGKFQSSWYNATVDDLVRLGRVLLISWVIYLLLGWWV
jgi:hypothetical protein